MKVNASMKRYGHFVSALLVLFVVSSHSMADSLKTAHELWNAGEPFKAATEVYPLAVRSNALARLRFAFYVVVVRGQGKSYPEQSDWEKKSHNWLLELVQDGKNPELAAGSAEVLGMAVGSGGLQFAKNEKIAQCWLVVQRCWEDVMISKQGSANCAALARQAPICQ
ncbi:hypothetical protein [Taklimakanibacter lacteus]|uniref:hypothetical protein n=1 Tax=Taklimakanibacter lacteus TaxID=2268456 RepID=UPI0013C427BE